jgi:tRNA-splicing ligase RtcB (3'-phosphate/5'-hydroxy nucleic acid ligase)
MVNLKDLIRISEYEWEIPTGYRHDMKVAVRIFATRKLLEKVMDDNSLEQAVNSATLPGLVGHVLVMPDMHQGYGFPIGGVAATRLPDGVISPGGIGYDINCGVRLLGSQMRLEDVYPHIDALATALDQFCPNGVGEKGHIRLDEKGIQQVCREGAAWAVKTGLGSDNDLRHTEEDGRLDGADPGKVSKRAIERGLPQMGTLGAGNHFIEIDLVEKVFDTKAANTMGIGEGCLVVQIHCGSRGFGHQVCTDYVQEFQDAVRRYGIQLPDRELVCAPMDSTEGQNYLAAMRCAANYAFANRQVLAHEARRAFESVLKGKIKNHELFQVYDIAHNMGKIETHFIEGERMTVCVHRKGATRAFGPGSPELPTEYQATGQPVLVPGSMGTASWVLVGTQESMERSLGSTCHGAGRVMSRHAAKKSVKGDRLRQKLLDDGIVVRAGSLAGLAEEAPQAYKDVDQVVETVVGAGIARKVARLRPLAVIKG